MTETWFVFEHEGFYYVATRDVTGTLVRTHPIPFESQREALRGAARLAARDESLDSA